MSIEWFDCDVCGENICDCGDYISCNCGKNWCSDKCAEKDGYEEDHCKLGRDTEDHEECDEEYCCDCDNFAEASCKYCREDDFEDNELLEYVLDKHLNMSRQELIENYKLHKGGQI